MPAIVSGLRVFSPATVAEALAFLAEHHGEGWRPLAGGTDVMMGLYRDRRGGERWLNVARLRPEWGRIAWEGDELRIGALATMADLRESTAARVAHPLIGEAASVVGAVQIQNRATVGGNIANGSPAGDTLPVWLALDAELELTSLRGVRRVAYERFMTGYRQSVMEADELLTAVVIQRPQAGHHWYLFRKVAPRAAQGISKVVFAATGLLAGPASSVDRNAIVDRNAVVDRNATVAFSAAVTVVTGGDSGAGGTFDTPSIVGAVNAVGAIGAVASGGSSETIAVPANTVWRGVRLAWGSMGPVTKRSYVAERRVEGATPSPELGSDAAATLEEDLRPIDDVRSTAAYRIAVARNLAREFLARNLGRSWRV